MGRGKPEIKPGNPLTLVIGANLPTYKFEDLSGLLNSLRANTLYHALEKLVLVLTVKETQSYNDIENILATFNDINDYKFSLLLLTFETRTGSKLNYQQLSEYLYNLFLLFDVDAESGKVISDLPAVSSISLLTAVLPDQIALHEQLEELLSKIQNEHFSSTSDKCGLNIDDLITQALEEVKNTQIQFRNELNNTITRLKEKLNEIVRIEKVLRGDLDRLNFEIRDTIDQSVNSYKRYISVKLSELYQNILKGGENKFNTIASSLKARLRDVLISGKCTIKDLNILLNELKTKCVEKLDLNFLPLFPTLPIFPNLKEDGEGELGNIIRNYANKRKRKLIALVVSMIVGLFSLLLMYLWDLLTTPATLFIPLLVFFIAFTLFYYFMEKSALARLKNFLGKYVEEIVTLTKGYLEHWTSAYRESLVETVKRKNRNAIGILAEEEKDYLKNFGNIARFACDPPHIQNHISFVQIEGNRINAVLSNPDELKESWNKYIFEPYGTKDFTRLYYTLRSNFLNWWSSSLREIWARELSKSGLVHFEYRIQSRNATNQLLDLLPLPSFNKKLKPNMYRIYELESHTLDALRDSNFKGIEIPGKPVEFAKVHDSLFVDYVYIIIWEVSDENTQ